MAWIDLSDDNLRAACSNAVTETLETMFFELPVSPDEVVTHHADEARLAAARFSGSLNGLFCVALSDGAPRKLAAGFLGMDDDMVGADEELSIVVEMTNVLCGSTMSRVEPTGRLRIEQPVAGSHPDEASGAWLRFPLECGLLEVTVQYERS